MFLDELSLDMGTAPPMPLWGRCQFVENISDPRMTQRIAQESGARIGGTLFSDALSDAAGPAPTYLRMNEHNARSLAEALGA
ncbi:hypothetical protein Mpe_A1824 [Methylibium petroleiphilum PM1]|uniref:Uncharacterized protein n=1 Tax=Methylibium petroleiphilum (strain ATCC BAA-1232 / LMG 22953 / PM1) TaxID=420662 RepID=A2SGU4_METPP|nr:hypothetical protein Mpe_A1824 [Methylibium petroleiphilum PM1]